uniref:Uncharacterized protein n=1 Tax=Parascaris equorum TaxID=6256 RepID=A0A914RWH0_PAREQ
MNSSVTAKASYILAKCFERFYLLAATANHTSNVLKAKYLLSVP